MDLFVPCKRQSHLPDSNEEKRKRMPMRGNWSDLYPDLLLLIFERLSVVDFCRARAVCSAWFSASRLCLFRRESFPWLILFPEKAEDYNCLLFNPEEDKFFGVRDLGNDFDMASCMASHGSWFLFLNMRADLYIMNPLTREKIHLPPIDCLDGQVKIEKYGNKFLLTQLPCGLSRLSADDLGLYFRKAALWIDERSGDYVAILVIIPTHIVFCRRADDRWKEIPNTTAGSNDARILVYNDVAYRNNKLYAMSSFSAIKPPHIKVWDFGGDFPFEDTEIQIREKIKLMIADIAIASSGDLLLASPSPSSRTGLETLVKISMFKFNPEKAEWEGIDTLGDEALNLDQQITVPAKDIKGIERDSIYFNYMNHWLPLYDNTVVDTMSRIGVFNLGTGMAKVFKCLRGGRFRDARWFFPGIGKVFQQ